METIKFEWDENKNEINKKKHGLSFEEAKEVFGDENAILFDDPDHSLDEDRFLIIGAIKSSKICIVSHCYRDNDNVIRLISAREATKNEKRFYEEGWQEKMREEYDIAKLNPRKNPYIKKTKTQITIKIDTDTIDYFKNQSDNYGIPYQTLINLYLSDCARERKEIKIV